MKIKVDSASHEKTIKIPKPYTVSEYILFRSIISSTSLNLAKVDLFKRRGFKTKATAKAASIELARLYHTLMNEFSY